MTYPEFELFLKPSPEFLDGERQLVEAGRNSIAKLSAFFTGEAKNEFGVEYRKLGQAMTCALETARRLGPIAKPLESHLRQQLAAGNHTAAMALGALGTLEEASVKALASAMGVAHPQQMDLAAESAVALLRCGKSTHPAFIAAHARLPEGSPIARIVNKWRLS
jgi:uncharacterized protein YukE